MSTRISYSWDYWHVTEISKIKTKALIKWAAALIELNLVEIGLTSVLFHLTLLTWHSDQEVYLKVK